MVDAGLLDMVDELDDIGAAAGAGLLIEGEFIAPEFAVPELIDDLLPELLMLEPLMLEPLPLLIGLPVQDADVPAAFALAAFAAARFCFAVIVDVSCDAGADPMAPPLVACAWLRFAVAPKIKTATVTMAQTDKTFFIVIRILLKCGRGVRQARTSSRAPAPSPASRSPCSAKQRLIVNRK